MWPFCGGLVADSVSDWIDGVDIYIIEEQKMTKPNRPKFYRTSILYDHDLTQWLLTFEQCYLEVRNVQSGFFRPINWPCYTLRLKTCTILLGVLKIRGKIIIGALPNGFFFLFLFPCRIAEYLLRKFSSVSLFI